MCTVRCLSTALKVELATSFRLRCNKPNAEKVKKIKRNWLLEKQNTVGIGSQKVSKNELRFCILGLRYAKMCHIQHARNNESCRLSTSDFRIIVKARSLTTHDQQKTELKILQQESARPTTVSLLRFSSEFEATPPRDNPIIIIINLFSYPEIFYRTILPCRGKQPPL